jgi:endonuclease/exonuclease/phosphatase family metal-dependent hydrolase
MPFAPATLRVMTYNVHACVGGDRRLDVERIAAVIAREEPDVVALQELDVNRSRSQRVDQAAAIAELLGMNHHFNQAFSVQDEQYGDAILSALPMRLVKSAPLPRPPRLGALELRGALWVAVQTRGGGELQVINTHLGLVPHEQKLQINALLSSEWIGGPDFVDPALLIGDFNATTRYAAYKRLSVALRDLQMGHGVAAAPTFPARHPVLRIDHMFATPSVHCLDCWTTNGLLARVASDHLPLVADLEVRFAA